MNRRHFVKASAAVMGAAFSAPMIVKPETLGLSGSVAPNSRIGVGLVGNGLIMRGHRSYYATRSRTQVMAVCDVNSKHLQEGQDDVVNLQGGTCDAYADYEEMIARPDIDAVVVGTPDHWHAAISIAAMRAGKDVYCEKPMTLTIDESKAMVAAKERYGRILQVGSQQRSNWRFHKAAEIIRNGWIGEIKEIRTRLGTFPPPFLAAPEPIPEELDYDKWLGPTPYEAYFKARAEGDYSGGWRRFWEYGSRKNGDWGAHHYDIVQWALGMDESGPTLFVPQGYEGEPYQYHQYENGLKVIRNHKDSIQHMIHFIGTEGDVYVGRNEFRTNPSELAVKSKSPSDERLYHSRDHRANWLDGIETRKEPICSVYIGHRSGTICYLAGIAERLERPITWNPNTESISGDRIATRMMDRPRRAGYELPA